jgi:hypothetical protein
MWRFLVVALLISADAKRLKLNLQENLRDGVEISELDEIVDGISYRLPNTTKPELYLISLDLGDFHANDLSFSGNVLITIRVTESTDEIVLHSAVRVIETTLTSDRDVLISHSVSYDSDREFMKVKVGNVLERGALVKLRVSFTGTIRSSVMGVYRGSYLSSSNERRF